MIRKLLIVFASGFVLAVVLLSAAWAVGGRDLINRIRKDGGYSLTIDDDGPSGPRTTRTLAFDGSKIMTVNMPVSLQFTRGDKAEMIVVGPANVVDALRWENGALSLGPKSPRSYHDMRITITAPSIAGLVLNAPGQVRLRDLNQQGLKIEVHGPAEVDASGRIENLDVRTEGVGSLDLAKLETRDAKASIAGIGDIEVNASRRVEADISGAGSIVLRRKPVDLVSHVSGLGSIDHDY